MRELVEENLQELRFFAALGRSFQVNDSDTSVRFGYLCQYPRYA